MESKVNKLRPTMVWLKIIYKKGKLTFAIILTLIIFLSLLNLGIDIYPAKAWTGTVYIKPDGSIDPPEAPIITNDKVTYKLTGNIDGDPDAIIITRSNIIFDGSGYIITGKGVGIGIKLDNVINVTVKNVNFIDSSGIFLYQSKNCSIIANNITKYGRIYIMVSSNNKISGNNLIGTTSAILLRTSSNNIIENNVIVIMPGFEKPSGILLSRSSNNIIIKNSIVNYEKAGKGIEIVRSSNNTFYHNNIISEGKHVYDHSWDNKTVPPSINNWDNGYPTGGNYWSNYSGKDEKKGPNQDIQGSDGIGDVPYIIDQNNKDRYPLIKPLEFKIPDLTFTVSITTPIVTEPIIGGGETYIMENNRLKSIFETYLYFLVLLVVIIIIVGLVITIKRILKF
jgi:parallel beta-helix repeat protein